MWNPNAQYNRTPPLHKPRQKNPMNYVILTIKQRNKYIFRLVSMCFVHILQDKTSTNISFLRHIINLKFNNTEVAVHLSGPTQTLISQTLIRPISIKFGLNSLSRSQNIAASHLSVATRTAGMFANSLYIKVKLTAYTHSLTSAPVGTQ